MHSIGEIVSSGSLWLSLPLAALAGLVSFASPCVLPLVPGYLGYVTGLSSAPERRTSRTLLGIALFVLGFTFIFVLMSVVLAQLGASAWLRGQSWVQLVLGLLVLALGLVFMGRFSWLQREQKIHARPAPGLWGAPILGITFGLGWAPCIGPTFAAVQALVYLEGASSTKAVVLTSAYCLGLGLPFMLLALAISRGAGRLGWVKEHQQLLQKTGGLILILIGLLLATGAWNSIISWVQATLPTYQLPI